MSLQQDTLVSLSLQPGGEEARKMTATSGQRLMPLLRGQDRATFVAKTLLDTSAWASTTCFLTWKDKATPQGRLLFQLAPSTPRTEETASGLWPTPRSCSAMAAENIQNRVNDKFLNLESVVAKTMWPTPTTRDHKGGRKPETLAASGRGEANSLNDAVTIRDQHGALNPEWVEWLMGFPPGWTDIADG